MKVVISDTSPLCYLVCIGEVELLPRLFETVFVPQAVLDELRHPKAPTLVQQWMATLPEWLQVREPAVLLPELDLDPGETAALSLAKEFADSLLIMDERKGRRLAQENGVLVVGTLGLLEEADRRGWLDFEEALGRLQSTNFRCNRTVMAQLLKRVRDRKPNQ